MKIILIFAIFLIAIFAVRADCDTFRSVKPALSVQECCCIEPDAYGTDVPCGCPGDYKKIYVDIKPGYCPNVIDIDSGSTITVVVAGTNSFNVKTINPSTLKITTVDGTINVKPYYWFYSDRVTPYYGEEACMDSSCGCHDRNGDCILDLVLKFNREDLVNELGLESEIGETVKFKVLGRLNIGRKIMGQDCAEIFSSEPSDVFTNLRSF